MSCWDKLCILVWKQWLIEKRSPLKWFSEISLPIMMALAVLFINTYYGTTRYPNIIHPPYSINDNSGSPKASIQSMELLFCPNNNLKLEKLVIKAAQTLGVKSTRGFKDEHSMDIYVDDALVQEDVFGAIQFYNVEDTNELPVRLKVSLRFPEFRLREGRNTSWLSDNTYPTVFGLRYEGKDLKDRMGPRPHYQRRGFLKLQQALSHAYITECKPGAEIPEVLMQQYPRQSWNRRKVYSARALIYNIVLFTFLSYIFLFIGAIKLVTQEKEIHVKQALKTAGVSVWVLWTSYFIRCFVLFLIPFLALLVALNTPGEKSVVCYSNNFLIFLFFVCFSSSSITLAFLISIANTSTVAAATIGAMVWFISFIPFYQLQKDIFGKAIAYIFTPLTFFHGFDLILDFEFSKQGVQWHNLFKYPTAHQHYVFGFVLLSQIICAIVYFVLAISIESGQLEKLYLKCRSYFEKYEPRERESIFSYSSDVVLEPPPSNLPLLVKIINLRKMYARKFKALDNISLELYEDQITVLMGPNGAGKTTVANILVGYQKPTQGTIRIYKQNVWNILGEDQRYVGYCPQTNILFDELTVEEHIYLFSRIKGFDRMSSIEEADKYVSMLYLGDKASTIARHLTEGLKRSVSIALALCAQSRLVVLDEPTAGVDPISKRAIWNMLYAEKRSRAILVTTHVIEEAEILGDRVAIICEGVLKCCGSTTYLKDHYVDGYRLVIIKGKSCNVSKIENRIKKYVPNANVVNDVGAQLCFTIKKQSATVINDLLRDLEQNQEQLSIQSLKISLPTLEDVFIKHTVRYNTMPFDEVEEQPIQFLEGYKLFWNRILAMFLKKLLLFKISWVLLLTHIIFVVVMVMVAEFAIGIPREFEMVNISLKQYSNPTILIQGTNKFRDFYTPKYTKIIKTNNITHTIFQHTEKNRGYVLSGMPVGATFLNSGAIIAWYNNFPFHSPPLSLNLAMNAILQYHTAKNNSIEIYNHPLPLTKVQFKLRTEPTLYTSLRYIVGVFCSLFIVFVIRDDASKAKRQQFVCGISPTMYWLMTLLIDFICYMLVIGLVVIPLIWLPDCCSHSPASLLRLFVLLTFYGYTALSISYLFSRFFTKTSTGYTTKILVCTVGVVLAAAAEYMIEIKLVASWIFYLVLLIPTFALACCLDILQILQRNEKICTALVETCQKLLTKEECNSFVSNSIKLKNDCIESRHIELETWVDFGSLVFLGIVYIIINIAIDTPVIPRSLNQFYKHKFRQVRDEEEDVIREKEWVRKASNRELSERGIVFKDVCKLHQRNIALNHVCFAISPYECFCLIGAHGAGKTTVFKIVTGDTYCYTGEVYIGGLRLNKNIGRIRSSMTSYCPQTDGLLMNLTGEQNLVLYALVRGVPYKYTKQFARMLAQKLDFIRYIQKEVCHYSGGNKRKLSAAIALMGNAKIIFLDEPGTGLDISTSKYLWAAICSERERGRAILLSTHSMEECETVCNRVGVLAKGKIVCIGTTQRVTNKFAKGYILTIRCKRSDTEKRAEDIHQKLLKYMSTELPMAELLESFKQVYTFQINAKKTLLWSEVFRIIDGHKDFLNIEDYTLSQSSLEQAFLSVS